MCVCVLCYICTVCVCECCVTFVLCVCVSVVLHLYCVCAVCCVTFVLCVCVCVVLHLYCVCVCVVLHLYCVCVCVLCYICTMCVLCVVSQLYCVCDVFMCNVFCLYCAGVLKCNCKTQQSYIHTYIPVVHVSHSHQQNIPIMCYCHPIYRNLDHFLLRYSYQRASPLLMPPPGLQGHTLYRLITNFL